MQVESDIPTPSPRRYHGRAPQSNIIVYVSWYDEGDHILHAFAQNARVVCVQHSIEADDGTNSYGSRRESFCSWRSRVISMVHCIDFATCNWVYAHRTKDGLKFLPRKKAIYKLITCPLWSRRIAIDEVEIIGWMHTYGRHKPYGYWDGKPVDIWLGYDNESAIWTNIGMMGAFAVRYLDVIFEVYGHLMDSEGHCIGIVIERVWGRRARANDMFKVYEAIGRLQRHHVVSHGVYSHSSGEGILIAGGKVRLSCLLTLEYYPPDKRGEFDEALQSHWRCLEELSRVVKRRIIQLPHIAHLITTPFLIPMSSTPERPIRVVMFYPVLPMDWQRDYDRDIEEGETSFSKHGNMPFDKLPVYRDQRKSYTLAECSFLYATDQPGGLTSDSSPRPSITEASKRRKQQLTGGSLAVVRQEGSQVRIRRFNPISWTNRRGPPTSDYTSEDGSPRFEEIENF